MKQLLFLTVCFALLAPLAGSAQEKNAQDQNPVVVMETNHGTIKLELFEDKAPATVKNFLDYVEAKHYDGTVFHRVIENFMIQGGGFTKDMEEKKTKDPIKNEASKEVPNERGTIAMARTAQPDSATAQFFINTKDNPFLDKDQGKAGYAVFGKVIDGMEAVDKISKVETGEKKVLIGNMPIPFKDVPREPVIIKTVRREKK